MIRAVLGTDLDYQNNDWYHLFSNLIFAQSRVILAPNLPAASRVHVRGRSTEGPTRNAASPDMLKIERRNTIKTHSSRARG